MCIILGPNSISKEFLRELVLESCVSETNDGKADVSAGSAISAADSRTVTIDACEMEDSGLSDFISMSSIAIFKGGVSGVADSGDLWNANLLFCV